MVKTLIFITGLMALFFSALYALEICEESDLYNLGGSQCAMDYRKIKEKDREVDIKDVMFEITKAYPYDKRDKFAGTFKRKIQIIDGYLAGLNKKSQTRLVKNDISRHQEARRSLEQQLENILNASEGNWEQVRDRARQVLKKVTEELRR